MSSIFSIINLFICVTEKRMDARFAWVSSENIKYFSQVGAIDEMSIPNLFKREMNRN